MPAIGVAAFEAISLNPGGSSVTFVAMTHPHVEQAVTLVIAAILYALEEFRVAARTNLGIAELSFLRILDLAAELSRHRLHAVADSQHRHTELEYGIGRARRFFFVTEFGPPERMMPCGLNSRTKASFTSYGCNSQYTCCSRTRRAISCEYCEPKSRMRIFWWDMGAFAAL